MATAGSPDCYLGIDLGTSGCRCIAIDAGDRVLAEARCELPASRRTADGGSEQQAHDWWYVVCETIGELTARPPGRVRAICVDATSSTVLLCGPDGEPRSPALMYDDRRAVSQAETVAAVAPPDSAARGPSATLAKLLYLVARRPTGTTDLALHQADWINGRLTGRFGVSDENNALKLGYDPVRRCWPEWLADLPAPSSLLPNVVPVGTALGTVAPAVAADLGLPPDTRVIAGTTDSNAATLAAGVEAPGDAVTSLGSTMVLKILSDVPVNSARHGVYSHRIGDRWLVGGASNSGGAVLRQFFTPEEMQHLTPRLRPDRPLGLDLYPLPAAGERFPVSDPSLQPRLSPRPASEVDFFQALLEGIAAIEAKGYRLLHELGAPTPRRVLSSGGGAKNPAWIRIRERLIGVPVGIAEHTEAAYGAALIARRALAPDAH